MSISPPSDIVLDVARAADPLRYREAVGRLTEIANSAGSDAFGEVFDELAEEAGARRSPPAPLIQMPFDAAAAVTHLRSATVLTQPPDGSGAGTDAFRSFEAMALASFVETMLPSQADTFFGGGTAGQVWRSMLAEQIARQMADAGGLGIAASLQAAHATPPLPSQFGALAADAIMAQTERGFLSAVRPDNTDPQDPI